MTDGDAPRMPQRRVVLKAGGTALMGAWLLSGCESSQPVDDRLRGPDRPTPRARFLTDAELRDAAREGLLRFETMLIEASARFFGVGRTVAERAAVVLLSVMHMFDSEAVTVVVLENEPLEQARIEWVAAMLERELGGLV